jgi:hypothetical protein
LKWGIILHSYRLTLNFHEGKPMNAEGFFRDFSLKQSNDIQYVIF